MVLVKSVHVVKNRASDHSIRFTLGGAHFTYATKELEINTLTTINRCNSILCHFNRYQMKLIDSLQHTISIHFENLCMVTNQNYIIQKVKV